MRFPLGTPADAITAAKVDAYDTSPLGCIISSADAWTRVGLAVARYGLVLILFLIGGLKFTSAEAAAIQPFIAHSILLSWTYSIASVDTVSRCIGSSEIVIALLISTRGFRPLASAIGSIMACATFLVTLSFILSTPGVWHPYFPALSARGSFLIKDIVLLGASAFTAGEALCAVRKERSEI